MDMKKFGNPRSKSVDEDDVAPLEEKQDEKQA